jgi:hypothetical protein
MKQQKAPCNALEAAGAGERDVDEGIRISFPSALPKASVWGRIRAGRQRLGATIGHAHSVEGVPRKGRYGK